MTLESTEMIKFCYVNMKMKWNVLIP